MTKRTKNAKKGNNKEDNDKENNKDNNNKENDNKDFENKDRHHQNFWCDIFKERGMYRWLAGNKLAKIKSHQEVDTSIRSTPVFTYQNFSNKISFYNFIHLPGNQVCTDKIFN